MYFCTYLNVTAHFESCLEKKTVPKLLLLISPACVLVQIIYNLLRKTQESYLCRKNITLILHCNLGICILTNPILVQYGWSGEGEGGGLKKNKQKKTQIYSQYCLKQQPEELSKNRIII